MNSLVTLELGGADARRALTSVPWPAERGDVPFASNTKSQAVPLFDPSTTPRLRRYLLLTESDGGLPEKLEVAGRDAEMPSRETFSNVTVRTLREALDTKAYVYRECEASIEVGGKCACLRMGLLPNSKNGEKLDDYSWWQWCRAERIWSGELADAWRIGGHLVPYTIERPGAWTRPDLTTLGELINEFCGDVLHGDVYLIVWRSGLLQVTAHFKSAYFHTFPKEIPAFPVLYISGGRIDLAPSGMIFASAPASVREIDGATIVQPWRDLRLLANKTRDEKLIYLPPEKVDVLPAGVSRSLQFNIATGEDAHNVARYRVPASWYKQCGVIEADKPGAAAELASRNAALIREETHRGGIDTGRVWRYLRRWQRLNKPQEDGAEWEGNLAAGDFALAYLKQEWPAENWELYLHHAYHSADVAVYHGMWAGRLECTAAFTSPLPKFRFMGILGAYLETGDPYLLEVSRALAGVYMAMESALQPRCAIGRDAYPLCSLLALYDYSADSLYLDFSRRTARRLMATQNPDGSFSAQAGAGVLTGVSAKTGPRDIHFGSGILSPTVLFEWATRDAKNVNEEDRAHLRRWADLMVALQKEDGQWYVEGRSDEPYTLTGSTTVFTLIRAGQMFGDEKYVGAVKKYLDAVNEKGSVVLGTHAFMSLQYAHVADGELSSRLR
jgi:hypothetical protein